VHDDDDHGDDQLDSEARIRAKKLLTVDTLIVILILIVS